MRLTNVIPSLRRGGAARTLTRLARAWTERGHDVAVVTMDDGGTDLFELPGAVCVVPLGRMADSSWWGEGVLRNAARAADLRRALRDLEPEVVVSHLHRTNVRTLVAGEGLGLPVVVAEHSDPGTDRLSRAWRLARRLAYRRAAAVAVLTDDHAAWARDRFPGVRVRVIPNPAPALPEPDSQRDEGEPAHLSDDSSLVLAMGRLVSEKGFDRLLRAFADSAARVEGARLLILGEGPERPRLERLRAECGLGSDEARLPGEVRETVPYLARAELFVLPSRQEAFPNALLEAMTRGVPPVAFRGCTGANAIIRHGTDGWLVPAGDDGALSGAIDRLLGAAGLRRRLGRRAREVTDRFGLERVAGLWEDLFAEVARSEAGPGASRGRA